MASGTQKEAGKLSQKGCNQEQKYRHATSGQACPGAHEEAEWQNLKGDFRHLLPSLCASRLNPRYSWRP